MVASLLSGYDRMNESATAEIKISYTRISK